jgi:hypothetical protein
MYCCDGFKNLISNAGQRGISALVINKPPGRFRFNLQSRAVTKEDEVRLSQKELRANGRPRKRRAIAQIFVSHGCLSGDASRCAAREARAR